MSFEHSPARQGVGRLLRPPAAAAFLGVAVQTLARWRVEGSGPEFVKIGERLVGYPEDGLHRFVAKRRRSTSERPEA
jgi:predicted DNA-binding transcriptional regulator AlpA